MSDQLDGMFGTTIVGFAGANVKVRRVLSRKQQRTVSDVEVNMVRIQERLLALAAKVALSAKEADKAERANAAALKDGGDTVEVPEVMSEEDQLAAAVRGEEELADDLVRGIEAMCMDTTALMLNDWSIPSLTQLFTFARDVAGKSLKEALLAAFPQSGSRG